MPWCVQTNMHACMHTYIQAQMLANMHIGKYHTSHADKLTNIKIHSKNQQLPHQQQANPLPHQRIQVQEQHQRLLHNNGAPIRVSFSGTSVCVCPPNTLHNQMLLVLSRTTCIYMRAYIHVCKWSCYVKIEHGIDGWESQSIYHISINLYIYIYICLLHKLGDNETFVCLKVDSHVRIWKHVTAGFDRENSPDTAKIRATKRAA